MQIADAYGQVVAFIDHVDRLVREVQGQTNLGVAIEKFRHQRCDVQAPEGSWDGAEADTLLFI